MPKLAAISDDPVRDWRAGDATVVRRLASLELRSRGLTVPKRVAPAAPVGGGTSGGATRPTPDRSRAWWPVGRGPWPPQLCRSSSPTPLEHSSRARTA